MKKVTLLPSRKWGNETAAATVWNCPNYVGELFEIGANQTPFLNMIGGLNQAGGKITSSFIFPTAQPWALNAASQASISETASLTAPTAVTYTRGQDVNTVGIVHRQVSVSYAKQSNFGQIVPYSSTQSFQQGATQPITNEKDFQIAAHMRQIALNTDWTFLNGAFVAATSAAVAAKSRGIITATTTNAVAAASAPLTKKLIDQLLRTMAANGAVFMNPVLFCNAFQKQQLSDIYGYAPADRNVGGVNIKVLETDFAQIGIIWAPNVPTDTILVADLSVCAPVFCPVPGKGVLFYEELSKTGASEKGQIYGQIGLDYGPEEYHGKITGLATS